MKMSNRERIGWALVLLTALISRLADLGHRAMSHDESLHAVYSRYLTEGAGYRHDPMMHGPLLFHLNALTDLFLSHTDFTYRLVPAFFGVGCVAILLAYRKWLGPRGALIAAALLTVDPAHLTFSRYLRNDIYISLFTLWMFWAVMRYREERKAGHLLHLAIALGLSFACKEVCYIHGAVFGSGCLLFALVDTLRVHKPPFHKIPRPVPLTIRDLFRLLIPAIRRLILSIGNLVCSAPELIRTLKTPTQTFLRHPLTQCALLMLTLALPFASALLEKDLAWDQRSMPDPDIFQRIVGLTLIPFGVATAIAIPYYQFVRRLGAWVTCLFSFWSIQLTLYTTLFHNPVQGFATGVWGGLGYWLAQHEVERGNSSHLFYLSLLLLYAPILLSGLIVGIRNLKKTWIGFTLFWTIGNILIYSWAGERMPWLLVHITLPLCLLTAVGIDRTLAWRGPVRIAGLAVLGLGLLQMTVNAWRINGPNAEGPIEPMMYAHSGAGVKPAVDIAFQHLEAHPGTVLVSENQFSWPMLWYFRDGPAPYQYQETLDSLPAHASVIFTAPSNRERFQQMGWNPRLEVAMTTWPRPHYHDVSLQNLKNLLTLPPVRQKFFRYYLNRAQPDWGPYEYPGPHRFLLMTRSPTREEPRLLP